MKKKCSLCDSQENLITVIDTTLCQNCIMKFKNIKAVWECTVCGAVYTDPFFMLKPFRDHEDFMMCKQCLNEFKDRLIDKLLKHSGRTLLYVDDGSKERG